MTENEGEVAQADTEGEPKTVSRRRVLMGGGATIGAVASGRALYNVVLGYGQLGMGTNLKEQDLPAIATERMSPAYDEAHEGLRVRTTDSGIRVGDEAHLSFETDRPADAHTVDSSIGADGRISDLFADLLAFHNEDYEFEFHQPKAFFDRVEDAETRPGIVTAIRNYRDRTVDPDIVERFADAEPSDPVAVIEGLTEGFRTHTRYDVSRYLAGSIEDNVIFGATDLRRHFEEDVDFEALLEADTTGIFCWELVFRSLEALQAIRPDRQSIPIAASYLSDSRHKHAFTGILTAIRDDGELRFPMTFVDYTHSTLYDDLRLTSVLGEGLAAYDDRHRVDTMYW